MGFKYKCTLPNLAKRSFNKKYFEQGKERSNFANRSLKETQFAE